MTTIAYSSVNIQTTTQSVPSIPSWFGEVTLIAHHLQRQGVFAAIEEQVRFARRRFGRSEVIDFVAVLAGLCDQRGMHTASLLRTTCSPLRPLSWPSLDATAYLRVQPLAACSPRWISRRLRPCARSFSLMGFLAL